MTFPLTADDLHAAHASAVIAEKAALANLAAAHANLVSIAGAMVAAQQNLATSQASMEAARSYRAVWASALVTLAELRT